MAGSAPTPDDARASDEPFDALLRDLARAPAIPLVDERVGTQLGPYRVTARIGAGGMGTVYRARDVRLERDVAVKVVPTASSAWHEARCAARASHPHIARVYDVGEDAGLGWIACELVEGQPLSDRIERGIRAPEAMRLARGLAEALSHLHQLGLVHGDVTPRNLILRPDGEVVLVDFGIASKAGEASAGGTRGFVAPEVAEGHPRGARADVWAFGAVVLALPQVPARLRRLAARCVAASPDDRPADGAALVRALESRPGWRRRLAAAAVVVAAATAIVAAERSAAVSSGGVGVDAAAGRPATVVAPPQPEPITHNARDALLLDAAVSPDGTRLAMVDVEGVWLQRIGEDTRRRLGRSPRAESALCVSWVGDDRVLVSAEAEHVLVDARTDAEARVSLPAGCARVDPRGEQVAVLGRVLHVGSLGGATRTVATVGRAEAAAWSPDGRRLALMSGSTGSLETTLSVLEPGAARASPLLTDRRLRLGAGTVGVAWSASGNLVVALGAIPGRDPSTELVRSAPERWAPEPFAGVQGTVSALSADRDGNLVFIQLLHQSDTHVLEWDGASASSPRRWSRTSRDDRPTSWHGDELLVMMRTGATQRTVRQPIGGGPPQPMALEGWTTWARRTAAGLTHFRLDAGEVRLSVRTPDGDERVLASMREDFTAYGRGRPAPSSWSFDCRPEGRCVVAELGTPLRLFEIHADSGRRREIGGVSGVEVRGDLNVSIAPSGPIVALTGSRGPVWLVDTRTGGLVGELEPPEGCGYQYATFDRTGEALFATAMCRPPDPYRLFHVPLDGLPRELLATHAGWLSNPTPSSDGTRLAIGMMTIESNAMRLTAAAAHAP